MPAHRGRADPAGDGVQPPLRLLDQVRREQRLDGDQLGLEHVARRRVERLGDVGRQRQRRSRLPAPQREPRLEHLQRPLIPARRLRSVLAVGFARLLQAAARGLVLAADQVDLRQRVEHRAGRLAHELQRAAHVERAVERLLGALEAARAGRRSARATPARRRGRAACPPRSCSSTLRSASASAWSWRCCISATFAWLPQTVARTSPGLDEQRQPLRLARAPPSPRRAGLPARA